jgi:hypothetical protein
MTTDMASSVLAFPPSPISSPKSLVEVASNPTLGTFPGTWSGIALYQKLPITSGSGLLAWASEHWEASAAWLSKLPQVAGEAREADPFGGLTEGALWLAYK